MIRVAARLFPLVSLEQAILLRRVHFWAEDKNATKRGDGKFNTYRDGHHWMYQSFEKWHQEEFPFWSINKIKKVVYALEDHGLLVTAQYGGGDRRKWYRVDYERLGAELIRREMTIDPDWDDERPTSIDPDRDDERKTSIDPDRDDERKGVADHRPKTGQPSTQNETTIDPIWVVPSTQYGSFLNREDQRGLIEETERSSKPFALDAENHVETQLGEKQHLEDLEDQDQTQRRREQIADLEQHRKLRAAQEQETQERDRIMRDPLGRMLLGYWISARSLAATSEGRSQIAHVIEELRALKAEPMDVGRRSMALLQQSPGEAELSTLIERGGELDQKAAE